MFQDSLTVFAAMPLGRRLCALRPPMGPFVPLSEVHHG